MIYSFIWSLKSGWKTFSDSFFLSGSAPVGNLSPGLWSLMCYIIYSYKLLNSSFNNNEIPHLPLEHFPPALPYWCCTSCFCGEREKKEWKKKYNEWVVISVKDSINIMSPIVLSFWPYVTWNTNDEQCIFHSISRPQSANSSLNKHSQCLPIQFFFFSFSSIFHYQTCQTYISTIVF